MIHPEEVVQMDEVRRKQNEAAQPKAPEVSERLVKCRAQAAAFFREYPDLAKALDDGTKPVPMPSPLMTPELPFSASEHMAYSLGQRSVIEWLKALRSAHHAAREQ